MDKLLTIVIPSYNVEKYIEKAVTSMANNKLNDKLEILIVNDGSKDNTAEIGKMLEKKYPESVKLINKENGGHGSTINTGIKIATGKYFKVIDGDDWVDSAAWERYISKLSKLESDLVLTPYNKVYENTNDVVKMNINCLSADKEYNIEDVIQNIGDEYQIHSVTFKTDKVRDYINNREHCFYVDQEYILFPLINIHSVTYIDEAIYQYRLGNINQSVNIKNMQKNREMHKMVVYDIMNYFCDNFESKDSNIRQFLINRIYGLLYTQINIYISMNSENGLKECKRLFEELNKNYKKIYDSFPGKTGKLMKINMRLGYFMSSRKHNKK